MAAVEAAVMVEVVVTSVAVVAVTLVVAAALTLVVVVVTSEVERAWPDPVSAVVARVITIAEAWVSVIRAGRS